MYSYLKFILYEKLLKHRQSFWITLYFKIVFSAGIYCLISKFSTQFQEISLEFCCSLFFCLTQIFVYCYFGEMVVTEVRKFIYIYIYVCMYDRKRSITYRYPLCVCVCVFNSVTGSFATWVSERWQYLPYFLDIYILLPISVSCCLTNASNCKTAREVCIFHLQGNSN